MNLQGRDLKFDLRGPDVALLHRELAILGFEIPESERRDAVFGRVTQESVQQFQTAHDIEPTGVVDACTAKAINAAVDALTFTVKGRVASRTRAGVHNLRVDIVDKNVGSDVRLATALTDLAGAYTSRFTITSVRERGKQLPDLQARVYTGETFLAASEVRYNASNRQTLNAFLPEQADAVLVSEHESLTFALNPHFTGNLRELQEGADRQDITYLANKAGWDARAVALAALADQFSARTATGSATPVIEPELFYALFRAGLPANETALYRTSSKTATAIWNKAVTQGVIPAALEGRIPRAAEQFEQLSAQRTLDAPPPAGLSSLKEILSISMGDDAERQRVFAEIHVKHGAEPDQFWAAVRDRLGDAAEVRLRVDGKLGYLTRHNAPLIRKLYRDAGIVRLADTVDLVAAGLYRANRWRSLIDRDPLPPGIPGDTDDAKRTHYAELMAAQVRLSHPTAVLAEMVRGGETPLRQQSLVGPVHAFLAEHEGRFDVGMQPVGQYVVQQRIEVAPEVVREISRLQRVHQITPNDDSMNALLRAGLDSALAVVRYDRGRFVHQFKEVMGGEANAALAYAKALQVHNLVLNVVTTCYMASNAPGFGESLAPSIPSGQLGAELQDSADVIAYPTLESLFGEMDYCACDHCRSILSPAAYLVDLLQFCDVDPGDETANPLNVLLGRRPDIQHLPLTCENTNTPLPYIDLVNETLEHYVVHDRSLDSFKGHNTDPQITSEELLATPQFVSDAAYTTLAAQHFPPPLPFHQPLESLRRYFDRFEAPLPKVMEALRKDDSLERADPADYGWRDILIEELRVSRAEYALLTDGSLTLQQLYGYPSNTALDQMLFELSDDDEPKPVGLAGARTFTRRVGISFEELVEIVKTRFVNPSSALLPKLEPLGVSFVTLKALKDGTLTDAEFTTLLSPGIDASHYGPGGVAAWVKDDANYARIMSLLTLSHPAGAGTLCSFDHVQFRYANPDPAAGQIRPFELVRLLRFIRLWKKLGWTIEQTDKAIGALYPLDQLPDSGNDAIDRQRLDAGFQVLMPRLGVIKRLMTVLKLKPAKDLTRLLACFAPIDVHGPTSLYRQMFLSPALLKLDEAFKDDGFGNVLPGTQPLLEHEAALRAAFQLSGDEFLLIVQTLGFDAMTPLDLTNVSAIFRRGWLARALKLSVRELLLFSRCTGIDPFAPPNAPSRPMERFIEVLERLRTVGLKPAHALSLVWNHEATGQAAPSVSDVAAFARGLRGSFATVDHEFVRVDDPAGAIARTQMALAYGSATSELFFGLLDRTFVTEMAYSQAEPTLDQAVVTAAGKQLGYDHFRKRLSWAGLLTEQMRDAVKAVPGTSEPFHAALDEIHHRNVITTGPLFARFSELRPLHDAYVASSEPLEQKRTDLLSSFLPALAQRRKRQLALEAVATTAKVDVSFGAGLLDNAAVLHAAMDTALPAMGDLTAIEATGLSAEFFFSDTASGPVGTIRDTEAVLAYSTGGPATLPINANDPTAAISGIWSGGLEAPEPGFYNIEIECDVGATASLSLDDEQVPLQPSGNRWTNIEPIELGTAGLQRLRIIVERVRDVLNVRWQSAGRGAEVIPSRFLYSHTLLNRLTTIYGRFLKLASLATTLKLGAHEMAWFGSAAQYRIGGQGWFNTLPVLADVDAPTAVALHGGFTALLDFARLKADFKTEKDERLLAVLKDPIAAMQSADAMLFAVTRWQPASLDTVLARFGKSTADLADVETLTRVNAAFKWMRQLAIAAPALISATTNEPAPATVRDLKSALRARYDEQTWLQVQKPINDEMRSLQRDALVSLVLHGMRADAAFAHIDTSEKLFEYFLMDVQMDPCMQTSRVRHALSSVQLFIERCLMNLEAQVAPSSINARQWAWMKRYRVWEANRKVFLWPENWLEPELRDDQSPFFKEAMSELLQSDITDDRAAGVLLNYLTSLDKVAKLEPCGMHHVEGNLSKLQDDVTHVVARTPGADRKYYYRRRDSSGWKPWEEVPLDIEDNPVLPVVWNGRLFLFWLRIIMKGSGQPNVDGDNIQPNVPIQVEAILCWSEYFDGKWQATRTSDVAQPLPLGNYSVLSAFDRSDLKLSTAPTEDGALRVMVSVDIGYGASYLLRNTHSTPEPEAAKEQYFETERKLWPHTEYGAFYVEYTHATHAIFENNLYTRTLEPHHPLHGKPWDAPFFYVDARHVFYVTTARHYWRFPVSGSFLNVAPPLTSIGFPNLVFEAALPAFDLLGPILNRLSLIGVEIQLVGSPEHSRVRRFLNISGTVSFGDQKIGPMGNTLAPLQTVQIQE